GGGGSAGRGGDAVGERGEAGGHVECPRLKEDLHDDQDQDEHEKAQEAVPLLEPPPAGGNRRWGRDAVGRLGRNAVMGLCRRAVGRWAGGRGTGRRGACRRGGGGGGGPEAR